MLRGHPILLAKDSVLLGDEPAREVRVNRVAHERWGIGPTIGWFGYPRWFLALVLEGRCRYACADREWIVGPGELLQLRPGHDFTVTVVEPFEILLVVAFGPGVDRLAPALLGRRVFYGE